MPEHDAGAAADQGAEPEAQLAHALTLIREGRLEAAEALCRALPQAGPHRAKTLAMLGLVRLKRGAADEALSLFDASLAIEPGNAAVHTNRGSALVALGRAAEALASYETALALKPQAPNAHLNRGLALQALGRQEEALASYERAIALQPDFAAAFYSRANALQALGRHREAVASLDRALASRPDDAQAHFNRGNALQALGQPDGALAAYDRALALAPEHADAHNNRGLALMALERHEAALASFDAALAIRPDDARAGYNRGNALLALARHDDAAAAYAAAAAREPGDAGIHNNWGTALLKLERATEALERFDAALALEPDSARTHYNRAKALTALGRHEDALTSCEAALARDASHVQAWNERGLLLQMLGRRDEVRDSFDRAIALAPDDAAGHWNKGLFLLQQGDFAAGWPLYEWRRRDPRLNPPRQRFDAPLWLGREPLDGKRILLHAEQGFGDTIQFCRYAPRVAALGAQVWLDVPAPLRPLMETLDGPVRIVADDASSARPDYQTPLLSLPLALGTELGSIPASVPYLRAAPAAVAGWKAKLGDSRRPRVGLAWAGRATYRNDRNRSIPLAALMPLLDRDVEFIGLQKEVRPGDDETILQAGGTLRNLGPSLADFADAAALIETLDLVISADTAVAHLAGALGKPVWILLPFPPDWRWLLDRDDSPWYPSARLFRQDASGDWPPVVARVAHALDRWIARRRTDQEPEPRSAGAASPLAVATLERALALYRAGDSRAAEAACEDILREDPNQARALALLGLIRLDRGAFEDALARFDASLRLEPAQPSALNNRGNALVELGRLAQAIESYDAAIALRPGYAAALMNRGLALAASGRADAALADYQAAVALRPDWPLALQNLGNALHALGRHDEALASVDRAIALDAGSGVLHLHFNRGNVLRALGRDDDALASYDRAIALAPDHVDTLNNRGLTLQALGRHGEALESFDRAIEQAPRIARSHYNRGNALLELGRFEPARASYATACTLDPDDADARNNWGNALLKLDRYEEAIARYDEAVALEPGMTRAHYNRGKALTALGRCEEALACCDRAIALEPEHSGAHWDKSLLLLLRGDYARGWPLYEWRWKRADFTSPKRDFAQPLWLGERPLDGKRILLHAEQGFGDTIQFCRYASLVARQGARVALEVQPPLETLLTGLDGVASVVAAGETLPPFDCHTPLLSLPLAFGTRLDTIPAQTPYLRAPAAARARWETRLGPRRAPRIGLAWSGRAVHKNDRHRSIPLADLLPLLDAGVELVGLQREVRETDAATLARNPALRNPGAACDDFADSAGLIENLDLVISVDTSVAHLAGALGKPVWIMLPFAPDWRWLLEREDSPWYPSARLFRQSRPGDWAEVIGRVAAALREFASRHA